MKVFFKILVILLSFALTGCFAEDYDVGVPTAHLNFDLASIPLTEANIRWKTASEDVQRTIKDIENYASSLDEIKVFSNQKVTLEMKENEDNGGDIWTDPDITVALLKDDKRIELALNDLNEFQFPDTNGNYVLEVEFTNSAGSAQYVGNIVIQ